MEGPEACRPLGLMALAGSLLTCTVQQVPPLANGAMFLRPRDSP